MFKRTLVASLSVLAILSAANFARADDAADAKAAITKLADSANYSWTATVEGGRARGPSDGKTEKDGYTTFSVAGQNGANTDVILKGDKAAIKLDTTWQSQADVQKAADDAGGGFSPELIVISRILSFKTPAAQAKDIADKFTNVKKTDTGFTADLAEATAKDQLTFRRPTPAIAPGADPAAAPAPPAMTIADAKGTVTITLKDGTINKIAVHLTGTRSFNGNDNPVDQTTTTEIKDLGSTKITVPDEAKKILEAPAKPKA